MQLPRWKTISKIDLISIRCSVYATVLIFGAAFTLALAFVTPLWLDSDTFPGQRFRRLGLWEACFDKLHDPYYRYDRVIQGCKWIFDEDYAFIIDFLEPCKYLVFGTIRKVRIFVKTWSHYPNYHGRAQEPHIFFRKYHLLLHLCSHARIRQVTKICIPVQQTARYAVFTLTSPSLSHQLHSHGYLFCRMR